jgi:hypothetical protein
MQGPAPRISHPQHPVRITVQLDEVIADDAKPPWLSVVNRRRGGCRRHDPAHYAIAC